MKKLENIVMNAGRILSAAAIGISSIIAPLKAKDIVDQFHKYVSPEVNNSQDSSYLVTLKDYMPKFSGGNMEDGDFIYKVTGNVQLKEIDGPVFEFYMHKDKEVPVIVRDAVRKDKDKKINLVDAGKILYLQDFLKQDKVRKQVIDMINRDFLNPFAEHGGLIVYDAENGLEIREIESRNAKERNPVNNTNYKRDDDYKLDPGKQVFTWFHLHAANYHHLPGPSGSDILRSVMQKNDDVIITKDEENFSISYSTQDGCWLTIYEGNGLISRDSLKKRIYPILPETIVKHFPDTKLSNVYSVGLRTFRKRADRFDTRMYLDVEKDVKHNFFLTNLAEVLKDIGLVCHGKRAPRYGEPDFKHGLSWTATKEEIKDYLMKNYREEK